MHPLEHAGAIGVPVIAGSLVGRAAQNRKVRIHPAA
jgi:hypothetical protein